MDRKILYSLILTDGESCIRTPNYDVFQMYKVHRDAQALEIELDKDENKEEKVYAFASGKNGKIYVNLINADMKQEKETKISFSEPVKYIAGSTLESEDPHDCNTKEEPDKIRAKAFRDVPDKNGTFAVCLKAASIQVLCFEKI